MEKLIHVRPAEGQKVFIPQIQGILPKDGLHLKETIAVLLLLKGKLIEEVPKQKKEIKKGKNK